MRMYEYATRAEAAHAQAMRWLRLSKRVLLDRTHGWPGRGYSRQWYPTGFLLLRYHRESRRWFYSTGIMGPGWWPIDRRTARALLHAAEVYASEEGR